MIEDGIRDGHVVSVAASRACDVVVLGRPGRRVLTGARADERLRDLLRRAERAVWIVPPGAMVAAGTSVVLGVDARRPSLTAAAAAGLLAVSLGGPLVLVHVMAGRRRGPTGWQIYDAGRRMELAAMEAGGRDLRVEVDDRRGRPVAELQRVARERDAALIAVGLPDPATGGRRGRSVAEVLARRAPCPVLAVPTPARGEPDGEDVRRARRSDSRGVQLA